MEIKKQFVVESKNQKVAVQIDIETFEKIEDLLENYVLAQMMRESSEDELYDIQDAKAYYRQLLGKNDIYQRNNYESHS